MNPIRRAWDRLTYRKVEPRADGNHEVYWGTHGCQFTEPHDGPCDCGCCECGDKHPWGGCVGKFPYYGPETNFSGADAEWARTRFEHERHESDETIKDRKVR